MALAISDQAGRTLFAGRADIEIGSLAEPRAGHFAGATTRSNSGGVKAGGSLAGTKSGRFFPPRKAEPIRVSAARGEFEPVQLILSPHDSNALLAVNFSPFKNAAGAVGAITARVDGLITSTSPSRPTRRVCAAGTQILCSAATAAAVPGMGQPSVVITLYVSRGTPAGDYAGQVELQLADSKFSVPLAVHVYDFGIAPRDALEERAGDGHAFHQPLPQAGQAGG